MCTLFYFLFIYASVLDVKVFLVYSEHLKIRTAKTLAMAKKAIKAHCKTLPI